MRNLLQFLYRYNGLLVFLVLQVFCFSAIFKFSGFHRLVYLGSFSNSLQKIYVWQNNAGAYLDLKHQNENLSKENAALKMQLKNAYYKSQNTFVLFNDTLYSRQYEYIPAEVINSTVNRQHNYLTLNVGNSSGIVKGMGVIGQNGIIGVVDKVVDNFSIVLPIINTRSISSVELKNKDYFGLMKWNGRSYRTVQISDIANHANIQVGDTLQTRGSSGVYPPNIAIGIVSEVSLEKGNNYLDIEAKLFEDFGKLQHVQVVRNLLKQEQVLLEKTDEN